MALPSKERKKRSRRQSSKGAALAKHSAPTNLDFEKALMFFHAYMYGPLQGKLRLYGARGVRSAGKVMSSDWEVFASILVKDVGNKLTKGVDLTENEVKSAEGRGSFEYQYHKNTGKSKLRSDIRVGHLFFSHDNNLKMVDLRYVHGQQLSEYFRQWNREFPVPYKGQRFRRSIPFGVVKSKGILLMSLRDGEVTFPELKQAGTKTTLAGVKTATDNADKGPRRKG